jgi:hypothetical protein
MRMLAGDVDKGAFCADAGIVPKTGAILVCHWRGHTHTVLVQRLGRLLAQSGHDRDPIAAKYEKGIVGVTHYAGKLCLQKPVQPSGCPIRPSRSALQFQFSLEILPAKLCGAELCSEAKHVRRFGKT